MADYQFRINDVNYDISIGDTFEVTQGKYDDTRRKVGDTVVILTTYGNLISSVTNVFNSKITLKAEKMLPEESVKTEETQEKVEEKTEEVTDSKVDYNSMLKKDLIELANSKGLNVDGLKKSEIIEQLKKC